MVLTQTFESLSQFYQLGLGRNLWYFWRPSERLESAVCQKERTTAKT